MNLSQQLQRALLQHKKVIIGRPGKVACDIEIQDLAVSRPHCSLEKLEDGNIRITDLESKNGTYVNGQPLRGDSLIIGEDDVIIIGNQVITLDGASSRQVALSVKGLRKTFSNGVIGLQAADIQIPERSFVAIMGPSGCGKSTLLKALTGAEPATQGTVEIFGTDLYKNYPQLKDKIGYVPQDDIVHPELTVERALFFSCQLRASEEVPIAQVEAKIKKVLDQLNLKDPKIRQSKISELSGGQRKRISIAIELLSDPKILFLDEPTSPLDPETMKEFLECLKSLSEQGTTVVMVTHKPEDLNYVTEVIWLGSGGYLVYHGKTEKYPRYFDCSNAVEVYRLLYNPDQAKRWYDMRNSGEKPQALPAAEIDASGQKAGTAFRQFKWLTIRYFETRRNDAAFMWLLLAQAPVIALLIGLIFDQLTLSVLFLMNLTALWLGSSNAAREIVRELPIYQRERMYNLRLMPYLLSKVTVLSFFSSIQVMILTVMLFLFYSGDAIALVNIGQLILLLSFIAFSAVLIGLLLSAIVKNSEQAIALLPLLLIPQIILSGAIYRIDYNPIIELLSYMSLGRNGTAALTNIQQEVAHVMPICSDGIPGLIYQATDAVKALALPEKLGMSPGSLQHQLSLISFWNLLTFAGIFFALKKKDRL
jgi:ABC-type multidrug transport system ATPase subunit